MKYTEIRTKGLCKVMPQTSRIPILEVRGYAHPALSY